MKHHLSLLVEELNADPCLISVRDLSAYTISLEIKNPIFKVLVPREDSYRELPLPRSSKIVFNSRTLGLSNSVSPLPDGLWVFEYSLCPNDVLKTSVHYFRKTALENQVYALAAKLYSPTEKLQLDIKSQIIDMIVKLEAMSCSMITEFNKEKANELYQDVKDQFEKVSQKLEMYV